LNEEAGAAWILERGRRTEAASHELGSRDLQLVAQLGSPSLLLTLKALLLPSTATETGPTLATADWRSLSLPLVISILPDI
jgi:hypothetical protein